MSFFLQVFVPKDSLTELIPIIIRENATMYTQNTENNKKLERMTAQTCLTVVLVDAHFLYNCKTVEARGDLSPYKIIIYNP